MDNGLDKPGSAGYSPTYTEPDNVIVFATRSTRAAEPNEPPTGNLAKTGHDITLPNPSEGGEVGQYDRLGWSTGFGMLRRKTAFTGRTLAVAPMGANPKTGSVGYSTRSQKLRNGVEALSNDYTPSSQEAAQEIVRNM